LGDGEKLIFSPCGKLVADLYTPERGFTWESVEARTAKGKRGDDRFSPVGGIGGIFQKTRGVHPQHLIFYGRKEVRSRHEDGYWPA